MKAPIEWLQLFRNTFKHAFKLMDIKRQIQYLDLKASELLSEAFRSIIMSYY